MGGNKWGYVDKTGKFVVNPLFDDVSNFVKGLAVMKVGDKYGYVDKTGKFVINPQFDYARNFWGGLAYVMVGGKYGYIDKTGSYVWRETSATTEEPPK